MTGTSGRLTSPRLAAFASLELPMAAFLSPLIVYIPPFYAGEMGLGLATVGLIFGLTKIWDVITDPIAGHLTDRYGPNMGRRRFWMLISLPMMVIGTYQVFMPSEGVGGAYFAFWMMFVYVGWTLLTISHISWGVELSSDYHERSRIAAYRQAAALIGALSIAFVPVISDLFGTGEDADRVAGMGYFILISMPLLAGVVVFATPSAPVQTAKEDHNWKDAFTVFVGNRSLRALLIGNMGILLGLAATSSALLFYVEYVLRLGQWATLAVVPMLFSGLLYLPLLKKLTGKIGKQATFRWMLAFQICVQPVLFIVPAESLGLAIAAFVLMGAVHGGATFLPQAMIADLKDVQTGSVVARTGIYVALLQSTSKISGALAVALMFLALPLTGFDPSPDVINDENSLLGLRFLIVLLPMLCYVIAWFSMRRYELDQSAFTEARA